MTPLPKRRHSTRRSGKRQSSRFLKKNGLNFCPVCHQPKRPHFACLNCYETHQRPAP